MAGSSSSSAATGDHQHVIKAALNTKTGRTIFQGVGLECPLLFIAEECCLCIFLFNFITPTFTYSLLHLPTTELLTTHKQAGSPCRCPCTLPGWLFAQLDEITEILHSNMHNPRLLLYLSFDHALGDQGEWIGYCSVDAGSPP